MRYCVDQGHSHFLQPWPQRRADGEIEGGSGLTLFLLAKGDVRDIHVDGNGIPCEVHACEPCGSPDDCFRWVCAELPDAPGPVQLAVHLTNASAALALDLASGNPILRVADSSGPRFAIPTYSDPGLPAQRIREILPEELRVTPDWPSVWPLVQWVNRQWEYRNTWQGRSYCPWRMEEILLYGGRGTGPDGLPVIAMCVHYAVVFAQCILALGGAARLVPLIGSLNGVDGHFVTEMWSEKFRKWILLDPQTAVCFLNADGVPANAWELSQHPDPRSLARFGERFPDLAPIPPAYPYPMECHRDLFRHIGIWRRMDFYGSPDASPPGHGTTAYAETDILWLESGETPPMFPDAISVADYLRSPSR